MPHQMSWKLCSKTCAYRLAKQHMIPVLPRNQQKPMKRIMDRNAVAYSRTLKNQAVRAVEFVCDYWLALGGLKQAGPIRD